MSSSGGGVRGNMVEDHKAYRCDRCGSWVRLYSDGGEAPNQWVLDVDLSTWYENGYRVEIEIEVSAKSERFVGYYSIIAGAGDDGQSQIVVPLTRAAGEYDTKFSAGSAALTLGQLSAKRLPPR